MQSLDRLLTILETVAEADAPPAAVDIAATTGLSLSTVSRLVIDLTRSGLLYRADGDRTYALGPRLFALAHSAISQFDLPALARPVLEAVRDSTGETTSMHVMRGPLRVCVFETRGVHKICRVLSVGTAESLCGSATGRVLLAGASPRERDEILDGWDLTPEDRREQEHLIAAAAERGYALVVDEVIEGITGLSCPVRVANQTLAAISVSGPSWRFTAEVAESYLPELRRAAAEIGARIGSSEPDGAGGALQRI